MKKHLSSFSILVGVLVVAAVLWGCSPIGNGVPVGPTAVPVAGGSLGQRTKTAGCLIQNALPDAACTPGAIFATATKEQICTLGYSKGVRDVSSQVKDQVYAEYGITHHSTGEYEVDHLISLELGGSNDIANLWPEAADPRPGFHEKDQVENFLHSQVCSGAMPLQTAQLGIAHNWYAFYQNGTAGGPSTGATIIPVTAPASSNQTVKGKYVASASAKQYYYCATDEAWKNLRDQLVWSNNASVFTAKGLKLHAPCS